jgi:hypothetical protein
VEQSTQSPPTYTRRCKVDKQTVEFAVVTKNGVVQQIGKSSILQPQTNFKGGSIKWYEDKPKKKDKDK